jgi:hypothetical protein
MAATGLLGINPYFKGVQIDTSKPVNLAIQLEQRNQAKREALDKYFMDYEKSINPAGMRSQDQDIVLKKLNDNKQFYMQNRDKILNPSKYGAEAQSQYMAGFKDILSDISKSKQASAEDKVLQNMYSRVKTQGLEIPDGFMEAVQQSQKPIYAGYKPVDLFQFDFNAPFSTEKFQRDIFVGIEPDKKNIGSRVNKEGQIINIYKNEFDKDSLKSFANRAASQYRTNPSVTKEVNKLIKTGEYVDLQPYYEMLNPKMSINNADPADVAAAFALSLKQLGKTTESTPVFKRVGRKTNDKEDDFSPELMVDNFYEAGDPFTATVSGKLIKGKKIQLPPEVALNYDRKVGNKKFSPNYFVMTDDKLNVYPIFVTGKTASGSDILSGEGGTIIDEKIPVKTSLIPTIGKEYGGIGYTRRNLGRNQGMPSPALPKADSKKETKAKSGVNWKIKK